MPSATTRCHTCARRSSRLGARGTAGRALRPLRPAAHRTLFQPAQDHDLRRLDRDPEEHHRQDGAGSLARRGAVDFRYTEEQLALQDTLQRFIARDYDFERRRALARSDLGYSAEAWARYAELGAARAAIPGGTRRPRRHRRRRHAGHGADRAGAAARALPEHRRALRRAASGSRSRSHPRGAPPAAHRGAAASSRFAAYEAAGRYDLAHVACRAVRAGDGWRLSGTQDRGARCAVGGRLPDRRAHRRPGHRPRRYLAVPGAARGRGSCRGRLRRRSRAAAPRTCSSPT